MCGLPVLRDQIVHAHINPVDRAPTSSGTMTVIEGEQNMSLTYNGDLIMPVGTPCFYLNQRSGPAAGVVYTYSLDSMPIREI